MEVQMYSVVYYRFMIAQLTWKRFTVELDEKELVEWLLRHSDNDCVRLHSVKELSTVAREGM